MTSVITIGNFDGLHVGHRELVTRTISLAKSCGANAVAITFTPHPRQFFNPTPHFFIHPEHVKEEILESLGLDNVLYLPFADIYTLTPKQFFDNILLPLEPVAVVLGANFSFGAGKSGNIDLLRRMCASHDIALHSLQMAPYCGDPVSSSRIRLAIQTGHVEDAAAMLTEPYALYGMVGHGAGRGHMFGFATANIHPDEQVLPKLGVYATHVTVDGMKTYNAVTAVTKTPSFGEVSALVESHLLGFEGDLYGHTIKISFIHFIRPEMTFDSKDQFIAQLESDRNAAVQLLM